MSWKKSWDNSGPKGRKKPWTRRMFWYEVSPGHWRIEFQARTNLEGGAERIDNGHYLSTDDVTKAWEAFKKETLLPNL